MTDPVLPIPAPMVEVARKLYDAMGLVEHGYTFEEFLIVCFLDGMLTRWRNLVAMGGENTEILKIVSEVGASHGMSTILVFLDQVSKKVEVDP